MREGPCHVCIKCKNKYGLRYGCKDIERTGRCYICGFVRHGRLIWGSKVLRAVPWDGPTAPIRRMT